MNHLFCLMGKSASGKDTIYRRLVADAELSLGTVVPYTTRPRRAGEADGVDYFFVGEDELADLERAGKVIELRAYDTVCGIWKYFTADDGQIDLERQDFLLIVTLEGYLKLRGYFGEGRVLPIYMEVEDGLRLSRALERERSQAKPQYAELCRRFLADAADFSEENLAEAGIMRRFSNINADGAYEEIKKYIFKVRARGGGCGGHKG